MPEPKTAVVTAASKGLGAASARALHARGWNVALLARSEAVDRLAHELNDSRPNSAVPVRGSVDDAGDLARLVEVAGEALGPVSAAVVNSGHPAKGDPLTIPDEDWHDALDLLFLPTTRLVKLLAPGMAARGGGSIVTIGTATAREPMAEYPISGVIRAALNAYIRLASRRFGAENIRLNCVMPGFIGTHEGMQERWGPEIPMGRVGEARELSDVVAFLCGDESSYVTGQCLAVDGGFLRGV